MSPELQKMEEILASVNKLRLEVFDLKLHISEMKFNQQRAFQAANLLPAPEGKKRLDPMDRIGARPRNNQSHA